jgi:hypothetical protein
LSLLARKGIFDAIKEGKTWKTTKKIIDSYIEQQHSRKRIGPSVFRPLIQSAAGDQKNNGGGDRPLQEAHYEGMREPKDRL